MSEYTSILHRQERKWVELFIAGELHVEENPKQVRELLERMLTELEGWHRLLWLWPGCDSDEPCSGKRTLGVSG